MVNPGKKMRGSDSKYYSKLKEESKEVLSKGGDCETVTRGMAYSKKEIQGNYPLMMNSREDMLGSDPKYM
jgi:hypothetical protein